MIQSGKKRGRDDGKKKYKKRSYRREDWERTEGEREKKTLPWERRNKKKGREVTRNLCRYSNK